jgi:endonuclease/exonuclease/phosphatase family metal-dependent hydrolase
VLLLLPHAAEAKQGDVRAQTLNLYLGSDLTAAVLAPDVPALRVEAGNIYENMLASDPKGRLKIQSKLIKRNKPDLIGVQEVETLYRGTADDPTPADDVVFDFERILKRQLKRRGTPYRTAVRLTNTDIEAPTDLGFDVRLVDHDILLVRKGAGVKVGGTNAANFTTALDVPLAGGELGSLDVLRGYVEANANVRGTKVHVVNTHLEAFLAAPRDAQADELTAPGGPLDSNRPVILLGDLNSQPGGTTQGDSAYAYDHMLESGFVDRGVPDFTCCFNADLIGGTLTYRIDHVMTKPGAELLRSVRTGAEGSPLTPAGQYASDHTGVVSKLRFP